MSEAVKSFVDTTVTAVREARTSKSAGFTEFYSEMAKLAVEHKISYHELAGYGASLLIASIVELAKSSNSTVAEATATVFQIISDMTTNPESMVKLWTQK